VRTGFDEVIAPGPKTFDFNLQQFSITDERKQQVDFSSPYYEATQAVITVEGSAGRRRDLDRRPQGLLIGAATGTTEPAGRRGDHPADRRCPGVQHQRRREARARNGQVDAIVVDLPTAFYITVSSSRAASSSASSRPAGIRTSGACCSRRTAR
jgi:polar amino acid transport system substrate-binding protein